MMLKGRKEMFYLMMHKIMLKDDENVLLILFNVLYLLKEGRKCFI